MPRHFAPLPSFGGADAVRDGQACWYHDNRLLASRVRYPNVIEGFYIGHQPERHEY
ncbi:hypothetical protein R7D97_21670 [Vibrio sp. Vb5031]|nr:MULTISPECIES: hypothetical protein [Vibrio]MDW1506804.1 hypothetical protein [Vibrio sp. Vb5031]